MADEAKGWKYPLPSGRSASTLPGGAGHVDTDELRRRNAQARKTVRNIMEQVQRAPRGLIDAESLCDVLRDVVADLDGSR